MIQSPRKVSAPSFRPGLTSVLPRSYSGLTSVLPIIIVGKASLASFRDGQSAAGDEEGYDDDISDCPNDQSLYPSGTTQSDNPVADAE